ncbi:50S ribosomal protein L29 [Candidatus Bathyarchaeota archaeon]|nr:50S ribosomal protein L29 [Candidatus Bathyarchaeota archaeon]
MPILRMKEIRSMSPEEREQKLVELKAELARVLTMVKAGGSLENTMRIRELKRAIARILTVQSEEKRKR